MLSGYVITETGTQALDLFDRCAEGIGVNPDRTQQSAGRRADVRGNRIDEPAGHLDEKEHPDHSPSVLIRDRCAEGRDGGTGKRGELATLGESPSGFDSRSRPSVLIRYAASLDDGRGFAAYDVETLADVLELSRFGQVLSEVQQTCPTCSAGPWNNGMTLTDKQANCSDPFHAEAHPDDPDSWPVWARPKGPKRQVARGDERFVLLGVNGDSVSAVDSLRDLQFWYSPLTAAIVAENPLSFYILVETDASWDCPLDPVWDASVVEWRDSRVATTV